MKRIIGGVTFNTATSTRVARLSVVTGGVYGVPEEKTDTMLYQTRGGAFFLHEHVERQVRDPRTEEWSIDRRDNFFPMTRSEAEEWFKGDDVEPLDHVFDEPPEAADDAAPSGTIYIRVPASLKNRVDDAARTEGVSVNAWSLRCMERCLAKAAR